MTNNNSTPIEKVSEEARIELKNRLARMEGRLKPIINLSTQKSYMTSKEAAEGEGLSTSRILEACKTGKLLSNGARYAFLDLNDQPILTEGHFKVHTAGRKTKKIKELMSGTVFNSPEEVAQELGVDMNSISYYARGKFSICHEKYVLCYLDEEGNEILTENHIKGVETLKNKDKLRYIAWSIDDNNDSPKYFKFSDQQEMCKALGIKHPGHVAAVCAGTRTHVNGWRIAHLDDKGDIILTEKHKEKSKQALRRVMCLNDNNVFDNLTEVANYYNTHRDSIGMCAKGTRYSVIDGRFPEKNIRLRFAYLDRDGKPILTPKHLAPQPLKLKKYLVTTESGQEIECSTIEEIDNISGLGRKRISKYLHGKPVSIGNFKIVKLP